MLVLRVGTSITPNCGELNLWQILFLMASENSFVREL